MQQLPSSLTLPDWIRLTVNIEAVSITRIGNEYLVEVVAKGGPGWNETFGVSLFLAEWQ